MAVRPFSIRIPDSVLQDLQERLARTLWPDEPNGPPWSYGTDPGFLKDLVGYWQKGFDWRKQEASLNSFRHFTAEIDGLTVHFIHEPGRGKDPRPLLLTHGWPDSFYRFSKVIPMLTDPARFGGDPGRSFDVIVPSLPGFGFSGHTSLNNDRVADLWVKLMTKELGYRRFMAAGGDLGSQVGMSLGRLHPEAVAAIHVTEVGFPTGQEDFKTLSPDEQKFAAYCQQWWAMEGAYNALQSTKPQTIGCSLTDSPVGLAAWIVEKFHSWSGNRTDVFTRDELLTNIMIYWVTRTANSAGRMYAENARATYGQPGGPKPLPRVTVPTAVAHMSRDVPLPRAWAERQANVQRFTDLEGGHFAALEVPETYANDVRESAVELWK